MARVFSQGFLSALCVAFFVALFVDWARELAITTMSLSAWGSLGCLGIIIETEASDQMKEDFSPLHRFLILTGTNWGGLGLGGLVGYLSRNH